MKKQSIIMLTAMFMASIGGSALAAADPSSPFDDVPASHWAYSAVNKLAKDGVISGYGDGTFKGDKPLNRYEMAMIVGKAMSNTNKAAVEKATAEDKAALDKLKIEFATELGNLGVRVSNLEKNASSFKWYGDARFRYQANPNNTSKDTDTKNATQLQERVRLGFYGDIADNLSVTGRLKLENTKNKNDLNTKEPKYQSTHDDTGNHGSASIDLLGLNWHNGPLSVAAGRIPVTIGQGIIWNDNPVDGIYANYKFDNITLSAGYGDLTAENWKDHTMNAFLANVAISVSKNTNITVGHLATLGSGKDNELWPYSNGHYVDVGPYKLNQYSYGFNTKLQDKLTLLVEGVTNNASDLPSDAQKNGWWSRLTYGDQDWSKKGTYQVYFDYMKLGNWAVDSTGWGHIMNVAGGNGLGGDGEKGWGLGVSYMLAKQTNLDVNYYNLKPYDTSKAGYDSYKSTYNVNLNFSF